MTADPLAEIVTLLQPTVRFSKFVECGGEWMMQRPGTGEPFYCAVLEGACRITIGGRPPTRLSGGDFMLVPAMQDLVIASMDAGPSQAMVMPVETGPGEFRVGPDGAPMSLRMRIGHCRFGSPNAALLVQLLPEVVVARSESRFATLMQLLDEETRGNRSARDLVLERLLELLLIEALRSSGVAGSATGIARGLADDRISAALCALHARPEHPWTISELAGAASLSRSAFFARFNRMLGLPPMEYLLAWRMALAQRLLLTSELGINEVAARAGYSSASTFTAAFTRHVGMSPARFGRRRTKGRGDTLKAA